MKKIRLHQFLSKTGIFNSKKDVLNAIKNGEIMLDDKTITNPEYQFRESKRKVFWNNKMIGKVKDTLYVLLNKPECYLSSRLTAEDIERKKRSVFDIIDKDKGLDKKTKNSLFCVGRLDENSSGLLILTNDGFLSSKITNPRNKIKKTYKVVVEKPLNKEDISKIEKGVVIDLEENGKITKYKTKECKLKIDKSDNKKLLISLSEGKKREIRRIFDSIGNKVLRLERISIGCIKLEELKIKKGEYIFADKKFIEERLKG